MIIPFISQQGWNWWWGCRNLPFIKGNSFVLVQKTFVASTKSVVASQTWSSWVKDPICGLLLVRSWNEMTEEMKSSSGAEFKVWGWVCSPAVGESEDLSASPLFPPLLVGLIEASPTLAQLAVSSRAAAVRAWGGSWEAPGWQGNARGPPWLAPVILPSHSSATDINNNSTSGFTLLSRVNPFHSRTEGCWSCRRGLSPALPLLLVQVSFLSLSVFISARAAAAPFLPRLGPTGSPDKRHGFQPLSFSVCWPVREADTLWSDSCV